MIFISHRGNLNGVQKEFENLPSFIDNAIKLGFDVEIDLRTYKNKLFLGHDEPQYEISLEWILKRKKHIWIHAKDFNSLYLLSKINKKIIYFAHQNDDYTLISNGMIWCHNYNISLNKKCIIPLITLDQINNFVDKKFYGVCSDYVVYSKEKFSIEG